MKLHLPFLATLAFLLSRKNHDLRPANSIRLKSVTTHSKNQQEEFRSADKTVYSYDTKSNLFSKEHFTFDVVENKFSLLSTSTFTFENEYLKKTGENIGTSLSRATTLHCTNNVLTSIHVDDGVDTDIVIERPEDNVIEAVYTFSNGRWFRYRISATSNNIVTEQKLDESNNLASEVTHEYDNGINPYTLLGYTDVFFRNYSNNNRTKTESEYYAIGFPQSVPVSYEYTYDNKNLLEQLITYKSYTNEETSTQMKNCF